MIEVGFKFDLGDVLVHVGRDTDYIDEYGSDVYSKQVASEKLSRFLVVERILVECHGGVQFFYVCRSVSVFGNMSKDYFKLSQIELEPIPERTANKAPLNERLEDAMDLVKDLQALVDAESDDPK